MMRYHQVPYPSNMIQSIKIRITLSSASRFHRLAALALEEEEEAEESEPKRPDASYTST